MAQQQLGLTFRTPTAFTATNEAAGYPATNLLLPTKWRRKWRSTNTSATLVVDFGSAVTLDGVWIHANNFSAVQLSKSTDNISYTTLLAVPAQLPFDDRCTPPARRKTWLPASAWTSSFNNRYLKISPAGSLDGTGLYVEIGAVVFPVVENMTRNWGTPFVHTPTEGVSRLAYAGVGSEVNVEAPTIVKFQLQGGPWMTSAMSQLQRLRALGQDGPFFLHENRGDASKAYLLKRTSDPPFSERVTTFDAPWEFEECV